MSQIPQLSDSQFSTLMNALSVAAERYTQNAEEFRKAAPLAAEAERTGKQPFITERGALQLAEQFDQQAADTFALIDKLQEETDAD